MINGLQCSSPFMVVQFWIKALLRLKLTRFQAKLLIHSLPFHNGTISKMTIYKQPSLSSLRPKPIYVFKMKITANRECPALSKIIVGRHIPLHSHVAVIQPEAPCRMTRQSVSRPWRIWKFRVARFGLYVAKKRIWPSFLNRLASKFLRMH